MKCENGNHLGVNNTTGACPFCGEQVETPSIKGFAKATYLGDSVMDMKCTETLYSFSIIYTEEQSNLGLFYQESHTKSSLDEEETTIEDILTKMLEEMKVLNIRVIDGKLMVVRESRRFTFTDDLEGESRYSLAIIPADDEDQIPFAPNITEEAGIGMRPFWYDGSGLLRISDFNNFVEVFGADDEFFDEVKTIAENETLSFYPQYLCLDEQKVDPNTLISHVTEVKVSVK